MLPVRREIIKFTNLESISDNLFSRTIRKISSAVLSTKEFDTITPLSLQSAVRPISSVYKYLRAKAPVSSKKYS